MGKIGAMLSAMNSSCAAEAEAARAAEGDAEAEAEAARVHGGNCCGQFSDRCSGIAVVWKVLAITVAVKATWSILLAGCFVSH